MLEMSESFKLHRLQQVDTHLDQIHTRLRAIETLLSDETSIKTAQTKFEAASKVHEDARRAVKKAEENVSSNKVKLEQTEAALYGGKVRNPKELQDLQNEAEALKRYRSILDDRLLEAMIAQEDAEVVFSAASNELEATQAQFSEQNKALSLEKAELTNDLNRLEGEREAASRSILPADLSMYEQLRKQRRGVAVATVADNTCAACGSTLSAAQLHAAKSPNQLTRCETCGRILYGG
jgi:predicted  nucleic acid-binding Zn-ribbon protein